MKTYKKNWIFVIIISAIAFFTMLYSDIIETSTKSYLLLDSIFGISSSGGYFFESAFYIPVHITFALWNLPFWILYRCGVGAPNAVLNLLWAKTLLVVCLVGITRLFTKLLKEVGCDEHSEFWSLCLATSFLIFPTVFDMAQYDCIGILVGMYGLLLALKDKQGLSVKTVLVLSLASSFKMLFAFAAICIVFIKEYKAKKIVAGLVGVSSVSIVFFVISKILRSLQTAAPVATVSGEISGGFAQRLFSVQLPGGMFNYSVVFLAQFALYFYICMSRKEMTKREELYKMASCITISYISLLSFALAHPQWSFFPGVFLLLTLALSKEKAFKKNIICEMIFEVSLLIQQLIYYDWVYLSETEFDSLLLKNVKFHFFHSNVTMPRQVLSVLGDSVMKGLPLIVASLTLVAAVSILLINAYKPRNEGNESTVDIDVNKEMRISAGVRTIFIALYVACGLAIRFII